MPATNPTSAVAAYFAELRRIQASGGATGERSAYGALTDLLNAVGDTLRPKVFCVPELADQGAGHPDFGLYTTRQTQRGRGQRQSQQQRQRRSQLPERGVVEVKSAADDAWLTADGEQVSRYWQRYRQVLVTNTRDFVMVGEDANGQPVRLETFRLADSAVDFAERLEHPRAFANAVGVGLAEYLCRALSNAASLAEPKDLAWLLASYARDGLARVERAGDTTSLDAVRAALEESLGVRFEGDRGAAFFRSTLVQTLFYGVFSAWALWARQAPAPAAPFDWRTAVWHLRAPVLRALFQQLSDPGRLQPLGLVEVLDWAAAALNRVNRADFFARFREGEAVPYFYEPFLQAFDPELRKQLGVWYTPAEVVRYMVARVDRALKDDLGIADGLAADNVYVLDPCCGTGAYLAETLRRIAANLEGKGLGALAGARVKQAATQRVFGFEIMPAPYVVAHLQVGLAMQELGAPLLDDDDERAGVFLTNALTGWEPTVQKPLPFPELEEERDRAERVKQDTPVLVIIGNPPYNGFAGVAVDEERELSQAYRTTRHVRRPEGQGLSDLYVRFFRMAERRIAEKTGRGVVCYVSNYSWLDGLSFTGMREHFLDAFDAIRIDNLHGDRIISEYAPDGATSETVFALAGQSPGIRVGVSIALMSKMPDANPPDQRLLYRDFHQARASERRRALLDSLDAPSIDSGYTPLASNVALGLPFKPAAVSDGWQHWPSLPDLFPTSFPGVKTSRDGFLVDVDLDRLQRRVADYFNPDLTHDEIARRYPSVMKSTRRYDARAIRNTLLQRGGPVDVPHHPRHLHRHSGESRNPEPAESGFVRYAYRPFDNRWLYWEADTKLLDEKRAEYMPHVFEGNLWLVSQQKPRREWGPPQVITNIGCLDLMDRGSTCFPMWLRDNSLKLVGDGTQRSPNLSPAAQNYLDRLGLSVDDLFHHVIAVLHNPQYRAANAGALRMEWPRIPLPGWPDGDASGAADELTTSAARGRQLAALLDSDAPVAGVTSGALTPAMAAIAVPSTTHADNMDGDDFAVTAGWGHRGSGDAVMPGQGRVVERDYTAAERAALGETVAVLGDTTFDVYLNERAYWRNVPASVWNYQLGGYQVLKKWLSYREQRVLGRALSVEEVQAFAETGRQIVAILQLATD